MNHAQLIALGRSLRVAGEHGQRLEAQGSDANTQEIRQDLERALALLDDAVSASKPTTRCPDHPLPRAPGRPRRPGRRRPP